MENIATYYVTLKPTSVNGIEGKGMTNITYVPDPAIEEVGVMLEKHDPRIIADEKTRAAIIDYLKTVGIEKPKHWREVTEEEYLSARELNLTTDPTSRESYNDFPNKEGTGQWLVRYEYSGPQDFKNRTFCADMMGLGRIYTEEEIKNGLSNSEFGNYSIFDYKGSYGCRHTWKRIIFFEDFEDDEVRRVGNVPQVVSKLDDREATTLNAFLSKDEKMQVCAPLLIPDKDIFRNDELGRYNMRFTSETIVDLRTLAQSKKMFERKDLFKDTHEGATAPSYTLEEWIIEDENDKAYTEYGFNPLRVPVGSWMVLSQITDKDFWEKEIKTNKKHAYSIEALMNLTIIKMSKQNTQEYGDVVVLNSNGEILILQRAEDDDYMPNKLCFAGGKIEKGEDKKSGALRELKEETGIDEKNAKFIDTIVNSDGSKSHYFAVKTSQNFTPSDEHKSFSWVKNIDNLPSEMFIEGDKQRLQTIINKVKMEEQTIVLPDGEHLINGTIYIVESGKVVATKEVTPEQEAVVEEVAEAAAETSDAQELEEKKPEEMAAEVEEPKVEEKLMETPTTEEPKTEEPDRLAKLEKQQEELMSIISEMKAEAVTPQEQVKVEMSDNRPLWKRISDGVTQINKTR